MAKSTIPALTMTANDWPTETQVRPVPVGEPIALRGPAPIPFMSVEFQRLPPTSKLTAADVESTPNGLQFTPDAVGRYALRLVTPQGNVDRSIVAAPSSLFAADAKVGPNVLMNQASHGATDAMLDGLTETFPVVMDMGPLSQFGGA